MKISSKKPSKQRKYRANLNYHEVSSKLFTVRLDDNLKEEWGIKRLPIRLSDEARIIRGEFENVEGKILSLNRRTGRIEIEECTLEKKSGATYYVPISPSNIVLTKLGGKKMDPWRQKMIDRKQKLETTLSSTSTEEEEEEELKE